MATSLQSDLAERLLKAAHDALPEDLPSLIGELERAKAVAWTRLTAPSQAAEAHEELLRVTEAARRLGVSEDYLYTNHRKYPFTRRQGRKLLFSASGIDRHIRQTNT